MRKKSSANAAMAITAAKRQAVAALRYVVLAVANFATVWGLRRVLFFKVKKLPNGIKDLKTVKSGDLKTKGRPLPPKNMSPPVLREFR